MTRRRAVPAALLAAAFLILLPAYQGAAGKTRLDEKGQGKGPSKKRKGDASVSVHYLEIVSTEVDALCATYERALGVKFGEEVADLGNARTATRPDGSQIGIRKPMAEHETPILRTYLAVDDIAEAVKAAEEAGGVVAYGPTKQGDTGTWAIFMQGDVQHGLWQK